MLSLLLYFLLSLSAVQALPVGEELNYRVKYGPLTAGYLTLRIAGTTEIAGESCYQLISRLSSNPAYAKLFTIDDRIESYARCADLITLRTIKDIHEANYQQYTCADFDYDERLVTYSDGSVIALPTESRDVLSLWYYFRCLILRPGDEFTAAAHIDKRNYTVTVRVRRRETVRIGLGEYRCLVIEMESSGPAASGIIYLTDDELGLPVIIKTRMPIGYITAYLVAVKDD